MNKKTSEIKVVFEIAYQLLNRLVRSLLAVAPRNFLTCRPNNGKLNKQSELINRNRLGVK